MFLQDPDRSIGSPLGQIRRTIRISSSTLPPKDGKQEPLTGSRSGTLNIKVVISSSPSMMRRRTGFETSKKTQRSRSKY